MFHPTIYWLSQVSLQPITPVPYSKHECGTSSNTSIKTNLGLPEANHLNPQPMTPPHGQKSQPLLIGLYPSCSRALKCLFQPGLPRLVIQPQLLQGFQIFFPTRASRSSNSTHLGLPECLSNQSFQDK